MIFTDHSPFTSVILSFRVPLTMKKSGFDMWGRKATIRVLPVQPNNNNDLLVIIILERFIHLDVDVLDVVDVVDVVDIVE